MRMAKFKFEICNMLLYLPSSAVAVGRVSLEYKDENDARNGTQCFGGEFSYRLSESKHWDTALKEAMEVYFNRLCKSGK